VAHASGLLAIALTNATHCEEAVRSGFVGHLITQLHAAVANMHSQVELKSPSVRQQAKPPGIPPPRPLQVSNLPNPPVQ